MEDSEMVSRSELGHQLEVNQPDKKAARLQTIDFVEKKTKLQLNMRDMAQSKITAVRKAVSESPNKPVKEVWDVADKARPDPTVVSSTSSSVAVDFEALHSQHEELGTENEALKASQLRVKEHEARLFAQVEPLKGRVWELEGELENKEDEMRLMQGDRDHWRERTQHIISKYDRVDPVELEGLKKQLEQLKAEQAPLKEQVDGFEARLEEEKSSVLATQQARIDNIKKQAKDQDTMRKEVIARLTQELKTAQETISNLQGGQVATDPMDYSMTAAPAPSPSPESQSSAEGRLTSRQERFCTNPISTADMAKWRLSPEQARYLAKNNKTLDDLLKADIISKVDQQTSNLKASIAKMEEEIAELLRESRLKDEARANLRAENTSCHTQIVNLNNMRKASGLQIASITKSVLQTPNQPVKEAWEAAVKSSPLQLLHRTKPYSEMICFTADHITVNVGSGVTVFSVPEKALCDASDFFHVAMKKEWLEGQTKTVDLPEDDPCAFSAWLNWIYRRNIPLGISTGESMMNADRAGQTEYAAQLWTDLTRAYALGDKLLDGDFKDAIVDSMTAMMFTTDNGRLWYPTCRQRNELVQRTTTGSTARKLLVHFMARAKNLLREGDDPALLFAVAKLTVPLNTKDTLKAASRCAFHEHGKKECYLTKYTEVSTLCV